MLETLFAEHIVLPTRVGVDRYRSFLSSGGIVLPTRVGVDRLHRCPRRSPDRSPHTRGGGPSYRICPLFRCDVLPTRVGVDRRCYSTWPWMTWFSPHAWGWTVAQCAWSCPRTFSPHAWGWTSTAPAQNPAPSVLPTRVGVDRSPAQAPRHPRSFSPHAWGWTDRRSSPQLAHRVLPTRVGVDRGDLTCG